MNDYISLYEVTPETGGIFSALDAFAVPWKDDIDPELLDLQYYGNISGEKIVSPLVYKNLDDSGKLTESKQSLIASMIFKLYGGNWSKEWATLSKQYDPIANYDMTETMDNDETVIEYGKTEDTTTGNTHTKTGTETSTPGVTLTTDDSTYGFNSNAATPVNKRVEGPSGTNETEYDLSEGDTGSVGTEQSGSDTHTRNYTLTRKGNIGVTTSQQLLQAERNLWMWNFFNDVVFPDVDKVLTIPIYAETTRYSGAPGGIIPTGTINITENGLQIDVAQYAFADVIVPNTYTAADEGKVVSDGELVSQTGRTITENGTYDTTENNVVIVDMDIPPEKGFELYFADNKGGSRTSKGSNDNQYFCSMFHDNMNHYYTLNGVTEDFDSIRGYGTEYVLGTTKNVVDNEPEVLNAISLLGSSFAVSHNDTGSYISVGGGWYGYPSDGDVYENLSALTVNSIELDHAYETVLIFIGASQHNVSIDSVTINNTEYSLTNMGAVYNNVYGEYTCIEINNNTYNIINVVFPSICWSYVSVIGID